MFSVLTVFVRHVITDNFSISTSDENQKSPNSHLDGELLQQKLVKTIYANFQESLMLFKNACIASALCCHDNLFQDNFFPN